MAKKEDLTHGELEALLNQLEQRLSRLRALYEQYFMGIERIPPRTARKEVVRLIFRLENAHTRNTALKFRIRSMVQRFNSYKSYWNRVERQIEEGTYKRDRARAQRNQERQQAHEQAKEDMHVIDLEMDEIESLQDFQKELEQMDAAGAFNYEESTSAREQKLAQIKAQLEADTSDHRGQPAPSMPSQLDDSRSAKLAKLKQRLNNNDNLPTGGANMDKLRQLAAHKERLQNQQANRTIHRNTSPPPGGGRGAGGGDDQARAVYNQLLEAKKRCNQSTNISYESVQKSMDKQREQLRSSRGAREVDFKVVIKDGKAFLKPEPK
jgi:hypothetical protein